MHKYKKRSQHMHTVSASKVSYLKTIFRRTASRARHYWTRKRLLYALGVGALCALAAYMVVFCWPRTLRLSYSQENCFTNPIILPNAATVKPSTSFSVSQPVKLTIAGYPVYSHTSCIKLVRPPRAASEEKIAIQLPGNPFIKKRVTVKTGQPPRVKIVSIAPIPAKTSLMLSLTSVDRIFDYRLAANGKTTVCAKKRRQLSCDTSALELAQATHYEFAIQRLFNGRPVETALRQTLATVEPVTVVASSIPIGQMIYDMPSEMTITFSKPVKPDSVIRLEAVSAQTRQALPIGISQKGGVVTVQFKEALPRVSWLELTIDSVSATDGGYLSSPVVIPFRTSGGPKVRSISIGSYKIQPNSNIVVTFDVALAAGQNISDYVKVEAGRQVAATVVAQGSRVTIRLADIGRCVPFTVRILDGLKNEYGVSGGSAWQFQSRTTCQTVFSVGSSVLGRSITAYSFGNGPDKIVVVGGTHGNERSSVQLLNTWIEQLEANPSRIASHLTIIVIPNINPDGYAAGQRTNANGVDLNRNFPSSDWKAGVIMPDQSYLEYGGGSQPLSQPESRALANYISGVEPRLVLTYHAAGGVVSPNESGDSVAIALEYARKSNVGYLSSDQTDTYFAYDTTGSLEEWLHDSLGIPALIIELLSKTTSGYSGHRDALWYITGL